MLLGAVVAYASVLLGLAMAAFGLVAALALVGALTRARRRDAAAQVALDDAWAIVAEEVVRAHGGELTSQGLASALRLDDDAADAILTGLAVRDRARVDVDANADVVYRVGALGEAREPEDDVADEAPGKGARTP